MKIFHQYLFLFLFVIQAKRGGNSGYTKSVTLSPELASLMGSEALPRHEVVKKMWAIIKERNLYVSHITSFKTT